MHVVYVNVLQNNESERREKKNPVIFLCASATVAYDYNGTAFIFSQFTSSTNAATELNRIKYLRLMELASK